MPKIIGIIRVRNEEDIIKNTLDHVSNFVEGVYVYDDCSTDDTVAICKNHPIVKKVIEGKVWFDNPEGRNIAEGALRQRVYVEAMTEKPEWIYYFDADEYADLEGIDFKADAYKLRLLDYYITEEDKDKNYLERKYCGPEYRDILMLFRPHPEVYFYQREPSIPKDYKIENAGWVKHYGKAISIEEWEKTCDYYIKYRGGEFLPKFTEKWKKRKGKAIHTVSDFGANLIQWNERKTKSYKLTE
jgi:glycosyltransferase involved in cell wall biosynthesis